MEAWQVRERYLSYPDDKTRKNATSSGSGTRTSSRDRARTNNRTAPAVSKMIEQLAGDWIDVVPNHAGYTQRYHLTVTDRDRGVHVDTYLDPWKPHETASRSSPNLIHVLSDGAGESVVWRGSNRIYYIQVATMSLVPRTRQGHRDIEDRLGATGTSRKEGVDLCVAKVDAIRSHCSTHLEAEGPRVACRIGCL